MNRHQLNGRLRTATGKGREVAGRIVGNERIEQQGKVQQLAGRAESTYGDFMSKIRRATR